MDKIKKTNTGKIKVLVLAHMFPNKIMPFLSVPNFDRTMAIKKYFDVKVVAPVPWVPKFRLFNPYWQYSEIPYKENIRGVEIYHPRYFTFPRTWLYFVDGLTYFPSVYPLIKEIYKRWNFDLIDAHQAFPDGFTASLISKILPTHPKVITTIHGGDVFELPKVCIRKLFVKAGIKMADALTADSKYAAKRIRQVVPSAKVEVIPSGLQLNKKINQMPKETEIKLKGKLVILTVGYLVKRKGHYYVILALKKLINKYPNLVYLMVGDGVEMKNLQNLVRESGLQDVVIFIGGLAAPYVHDYYKKSDIFIMPSWEEALGVVYMEAMFHAKPVIGSKGEGGEELIDHGVNGYLVKSRNINQIAFYLEKLIKDSKLRETMGKSGREKALKVFSQTNRAKQIFKFYSSIQENHVHEN